MLRGGWWGVLSLIVAAALLGAPVPSPGASAPAVAWRSLGTGIEYALVVVPRGGHGAGGDLHLVRVDPRRARLSLVTASEQGGLPRTAASWCKERSLAVAINAGMFQMDHRSNVGLLRAGAHRNNPKIHPSYRSILVFDPSEAARPAVAMLDAEGPSWSAELGRYRSAVQNLRLIKGGRTSVWKSSPRRWSEAAVGVDGRGSVLFAFTRAPYSMQAFNGLLLGLPIGLDAAMHVEGGPEASLSIHAGGVDLDLAGSFETGFLENDGNAVQWPIPNVLGVPAI